jgi:hypothetical protein
MNWKWLHVVSVAGLLVALVPSAAQARETNKTVGVTQGTNAILSVPKATGDKDHKVVFTLTNRTGGLPKYVNHTSTDGGMNRYRVPTANPFVQLGDKLGYQAKVVSKSDPTKVLKTINYTIKVLPNNRAATATTHR